MSKTNQHKHEIIAQNRVARHRFFILETYETGIELRGSEVKSIRQGAIQLKEGYAHVKNGELILEGVHISPYSHQHQPLDCVRSRRLLMHKHEITHIQNEVTQKRLALVPLNMYLKQGKVKLALALAKGKKLHDKRASIREKEMQRILDRAHKHVR